MIGATPKPFTLTGARAELVDGVNVACQMLASPPAGAIIPAFEIKRGEIRTALDVLGQIGFGQPGLSSFKGSGVHATVAEWVGQHGLNERALPIEAKCDPAQAGLLTFGDLGVEFQRTLRIPDDGATYSLPAGFGPFPLHEVSGLGDGVPAAWRETGGVLMPMYQREAMWINFHSSSSEGRYTHPYAVKIGAGRINVISGKRWHRNLNRVGTDYLVAPNPQYWLDGFNAGQDEGETDIIRQFVAMPLGSGYSVEEQLVGDGYQGGLRLLVYAMKPEKLVQFWSPHIRSTISALHMSLADPQCDPSNREVVYCLMCSTLGGEEMGMAQGGKMKQQIFDDPHGFEAWDLERSASIFVRTVNSEQWAVLTGQPTPETPVTRVQYEGYGIPWFDLYDEAAGSLNADTPLGGAASLAEKDAASGADTDAAAPVDESKGPHVVIPSSTGAVPKDA